MISVLSETGLNKSVFYIHQMSTVGYQTPIWVQHVLSQNLTVQ